MRKACTKEQHELFDTIFGSDESEFKVDDWVITITETSKFYNKPKVGEVFKIVKISNEHLYFNENNSVKKDRVRLATPEEIKFANIPINTPYFVRDSTIEWWKLAYYNGNGRFTPTPQGGTLSIHDFTYAYSVPLDINNLPKE